MLPNGRFSFKSVCSASKWQILASKWSISASRWSISFLSFSFLSKAGSTRPTGKKCTPAGLSTVGNTFMRHCKPAAGAGEMQLLQENGYWPRLALLELALLGFPLRRVLSPPATTRRSATGREKHLRIYGAAARRVFHENDVLEEGVAWAARRGSFKMVDLSEPNLCRMYSKPSKIKKNKQMRETSAEAAAFFLSP